MTSSAPGDGEVVAVGEGLDEGAWLAGLIGLPDMFPARLAALLGICRRRDDGSPPRQTRSARDAWGWLVSGDPLEDDRVRRRCEPDPAAAVARWKAVAAETSVEAEARRYRRTGVAIHPLGGPTYPLALADDGQAPYVLYTAGELHRLDGPRVAIVGTRRCSAAGRDTARQFGRELAAVGVRVVSGLALGIDAAAHLGALEARAAPPVGVVAGGLDRPYPVRHAQLWRDVALAGVLVSEAPLGTRSEGWRFPARNRVIAALADVVVVIESHGGGGSIITADHAVSRGIPVMAVPGPIRAPSSVGTNRLLCSGAAPALDTADILTALALQRPGTVLLPAGGPAPLSAPADDGPPEGTTPRAVFDAVDWAPTATELILSRTGLAPGVVAAALTALEMEGRVRGGSTWWERTAPGGR